MIAAKKQQRNLMDHMKATTTSGTDGAFVMSKCSSSAAAPQKRDSIGGGDKKSKVQTIINGTKQGK